jgi:hypothetical protein
MLRFAEAFPGKINIDDARRQEMLGGWLSTVRPSLIFCRKVSSMYQVCIVMR